MEESSQIPLLILPATTGTNLHRFFDLSNGTTHERHLQELDDKRYCLSSKGWLLTIVKKKWSMTLFNPFSGSQIQLPHLKTLKDWKQQLRTRMMCALFVDKCVLSSNPLDSSDYIVMIIHGGTRKLAYYKPGDQAWTTIDAWRGSYLDVTYCRDQFYSIDVKGRVMSFDLRGGSVEVVQVAKAPRVILPRFIEKMYIVESNGVLLVILRFGTNPRYEDDDDDDEAPNQDEEGIVNESEDEDMEERDDVIYGTYRFQVFEVDLSTNTWKETKDLGNRALFLGHNSSVSVEASDGSGCKPNCIYFTDDCVDAYIQYPGGGGKDMGVYDIEDGSIEPHFTDQSFDRFNSPSWIERSSPS